MPTLIAAPAIITAAGQPPKKIEEFIGRVTSTTDALSVARMTSPAGWVEPGQTPEFDEFPAVLRSMFRIESKTGTLEVSACSTFITHQGEWGRYSTPQGAEYITVCLPEYSPSTVRWDS